MITEMHKNVKQGLGPSPRVKQAERPTQNQFGKFPLFYSLTANTRRESSTRRVVEEPEGVISAFIVELNIMRR